MTERDRANVYVNIELYREYLNYLLNDVHIHKNKLYRYISFDIKHLYKICMQENVYFSKTVCANFQNHIHKHFENNYKRRVVTLDEEAYDIFKVLKKTGYDTHAFINYAIFCRLQSAREETEKNKVR